MVKRTAGHATYLSLSSAMSESISIVFFTRFFRTTLRILFCWSVSREMLRGRSSESTIPLTKLRYSGMRSSQSSMMNTRRTYNLMLLRFFFDSKRSKGALQLVSWDRPEEREGVPLGDEEDRLELELSLDGEVLDGKVVLPVVGERLVESAVLLDGDVGGVAGPEGLGLVELDLLGDLDGSAALGRGREPEPSP